MAATLSLDYYDWILAGIAALIAIGAVAGATTAVGFPEGLAAGSLAATVLVYHTLFRNPPTTETSVQYRTAVVVWHAYVAVVLWLSV